MGKGSTPCKASRVDPGEYYKMLGTVNAETSDCSRPADSVSIHEGIHGSVAFGLFTLLSRIVFGVLEEWKLGQLEAQVSSCQAGKEQEAMRRTATLARVLSHQERHDDEEKGDGVHARVLLENHPDIGEGDAWCWIACFYCDARDHRHVSAQHQLQQ